MFQIMIMNIRQRKIKIEPQHIQQLKIVLLDCAQDHSISDDYYFILLRDKKNDDTKENEDLPKKQGESLSTDQNRPALRKSSVGSVDSTNRGIRKAFLDAGIGINSKLGVKKTEVSSGSLSRDASDEGNRLLKKTPIQAEKCKFTESYLSLSLNTRGSWGNSRKLCKPSTVSRFCITVVNSSNSLSV